MKDIYKTGRTILDPLGIGDAFFGDDPEMGDTSASEAARQKAMEEWKASLPQSYQQDESVGDLSPEMLGALPQLQNSEMQGIQTDPAYKNYQIAALRDLEERSKEGITAQDRADMARLDADVNRQNAGRIGAIKQNMAARGMGGSGNELVAELATSQEGTQRQAQAALEREAMIQNNKRAATAQLGQMGGQMQAQDFGQQSQKAQAQDAINRFNTANSVSRVTQNNQTTNDAAKANLANRQAIASRNTAGQNQFTQNRFDNVGGVSKLGYNSATNDINSTKQEYQNAVDSKQKKKDQLLNVGVQGASAAAMFSDENVKEKISKLSDSDIDEFLESLAPKKFKYKDPSMGEGKRVGILAQDIENTKVGKNVVKESDEGKQLDINNLIGALVASVAHLNKRTK